VQRTSSDLRLNPHLHVVFLDGAYPEDGAALAWDELGHLKTREVGEVLERAVQRIARYLRRRGAIETSEGDGDDPEHKLAASAVSGQVPPAGPPWTRDLPPCRPARSPSTSRSAPRSTDSRCMPRPAPARSIAQERVEPRPDGLVRIALKRAYADGTVAVEMDPLSLLCRLATAVPPPVFIRSSSPGSWRRRARGDLGSHRPPRLAP
jgi:hypothetical protein